MVSALAALMRSTPEGWNKTAADIRNRMHNSASLLNDLGSTWYLINAYDALFDVITSIEDAIWVEGPPLVNEFGTCRYDGHFEDNPPPNSIVGNWYWYLQARKTNGWIDLQTGQTTGFKDTHWDCVIPDISENQNWLKDNNGNIVARINVTAQDDEGFWHSDFFNIKIDVKPAPPQNLRLAEIINDHPKIAWDSNSEPDLKEYEVWRQYAAFWYWELATVTTNNYWIDTETGMWDPLMGIYYKLKAVDLGGVKSQYSNQLQIFGYPIENEQSSPEEITVLVPNDLSISNYPNPFNPSTTINFGLPRDGQVEINIYSATGQKVKTLINGFMEKGFHSVTWNGLNEFQQRVASGMYIYEMRAGDKRLVKKMLMMK